MGKIFCFMANKASNLTRRVRVGCSKPNLGGSMAIPSGQRESIRYLIACGGNQCSGLTRNFRLNLAGGWLTVKIIGIRYDIGDQPVVIFGFKNTGKDCMSSRARRNRRKRLGLPALKDPGVPCHAMLLRDATDEERRNWIAEGRNSVLATLELLQSVPGGFLFAGHKDTYAVT